MKRTELFGLLCSVLAASPVFGDEIERRDLNSRKSHHIAVSGTRVTTVSFPSPLQALDGAFLTTDSKNPGLFQLAYANGANFFSVRALKKDAKTNLNVRWNNETHVLLLEESKEPVYSLVFSKPQEVRRVSKPVSPPALLGILDKAKAYPFLKQHHPRSVENVLYVDHRKEPPSNSSGALIIHIDEVFRFTQHDTLVFSLRLENPSEQTLHYYQNSFRIHSGAWILPQSIADASGSVPAKSTMRAYVAASYTLDGGIVELAPDNEFVIDLTLYTPLEQTFLGESNK